jgi:hypothetical protein
LQKAGEWHTDQKERGTLKRSKKTKTNTITKTNCMMTKLRKEEKAPRFQTNSHDAMRKRYGKPRVIIFITQNNAQLKRLTSEKVVPPCIL